MALQSVPGSTDIFGRPIAPAILPPNQLQIPPMFAPYQAPSFLPKSYEPVAPFGPQAPLPPSAGFLDSPPPPPAPEPPTSPINSLGAFALGQSLPSLSGIGEAVGSLIPSSQAGTDLAYALFGDSTIPSTLTAGQSAVGNAIPFIGGPIAAYDLISNFGDISPIQGGLGGAAIGSSVAALASIPTLPTMIAAAVLGAALSLFNNKKNPRELQRQSIRENLSTILGEDRTFPGVRGSTLQIEHHELDPNNPLHVQAIAFADPVAEAIAKGDAKKREDISALFANAVANGAQSEADVKNNFLSLLQKLKLNAKDIYSGIKQALSSGKIDTQRATVYAMSLSPLVGKPPSAIMEMIGL